MTAFIAYGDESGDEQRTFYSVVLVPQETWNTALEHWLKFRQWMFRTYGVPARYELHAYEWIPAKESVLPVPTRPNDAINRSQSLRREIAVKALKTISTIGGMRVLTCWADGPRRVDAYRVLIADLDQHLTANGDTAVVVNDGDPRNPDPNLQRIHRDLEDIRARRIVEDPWTQASESSQFIQIADLVAHCGFQAHARSDERRFMWAWYPEHLHEREIVCRCP